MDMDPLSLVALTLALVAAGFYVLFLVIRAAVAQALREHRQALIEGARDDSSRAQVP
jgi:hypothetical protein